MVINSKSQVSSVNKYDPPMDVVAARNHMTHLLYQLMQPQMLYDRLVQIIRQYYHEQIRYLSPKQYFGSAS